MHIFIPSRERHQTMSTVIPPKWEDRAHLVVHKSERKNYRKRFPDLDIITHNLDNIAAIRQWIFDISPTRFVCQIDDDEAFATRIPGTTKLKKSTLDDTSEMLDHLEFLVKEKHFAAASIGQRFMQQTRPDYNYWGSINSVWVINRKVMKNNNIRINSDIPVMENQILTMDLLTRGFQIAQTSRWVYTSGLNTAGGCSIYRDMKNQQVASEYYAKRFPKYIKLTKTYDDESMRSSNWRTSWAKIKKDNDIYDQ